MKDSQYYYEIAVEYLKKDDFEGTLVYLITALSMNPSDKVYKKLYKVFCELGFNEEADIMLEKAFKLNPANNKTAFLYAKLLVDKMEKENAKKILCEILDRDASFSQASLLLEELTE